MNKVTPIIRLAGPVSAILTAAFGGFLPQYWLLGVALWMLIWWITETVHLGVTALLPLVLFPALEIAGAKSLAAYYAHPLVYLFFGGFVLALALEKTGLHYRIALWILRKTGTKDHQLLAGFMLATAFMSMWISNTATAIMMLPIATSVVAVLEPQQREKLSRPILLSVAWAANIGGMATLIGTPPNMIFAGFMSEQLNKQIGFVEWLPIGLSASILLGLVAYAILKRGLVRSDLSLEEEGRTQDWLREEWGRLGALSSAQRRVAAIFTLTAVLWIIRPYLGKWLPFVQWSDTGIALVAALLLFSVTDGVKDSLLKWEDTKALPWGILLLFGGGLALAGTLQGSPWFVLLGEQLQSLQGIPFAAWLFVMALLGVFATELLSNMALVSALLPLVYSLALALGLDFYTLSLPLVLGASCAFMLPMATPPNAIVFSTGNLSMPYMIYRGVALNLLSVVLLFALTLLYQFMG
ncbi:SLC13 family permease [Schleiferiaceae bacterium]|nr:SLC13 family permease [Schleiferiaceae bacterium]MDA9945355.1 SLC13 family permease [Schleiferiaceae bacterium]MDB4123684.1 SLC13 family permease [Schleiferiaceae bacterium]MDC1537104.1 SLC13 family permease [Schleiferiaceae bacterium]